MNKVLIDDMVSELQINANKENSEKSTGPTDTSKTRFNAVKHGIFSKKFVEKSDMNEYEMILDEIVIEFLPKSIIEFRILEKMAISLWESQKILDTEQKSNYTIRFGDTYNLIETLQRYKIEADNKFYKAIKMLNAVRNDYKL
ncbi:MAG: hypothetical protein ABIH65_03430 [Nanoarchaeota archaeon]